MQEASFKLYFTKDGPKDKNIFARCQRSFRDLINTTRDIAKRVKHQDVQRVADFLLKGAYLRLIESQGEDLFFVKDYGRGKMAVVFSIEDILHFRDLVASNYWGFFRPFKPRTKDPMGEFIALTDSSRWSPLFQAVNFFHEGRHALDYLKFGADYFKLSAAEKELPAHNVEIQIVLAYGGERLVRLAQKHAADLRKQILPGRANLEVVLRRFRLGQYDEELDLIFGPAMSDQERLLRMDRLTFGFITRLLG